MSHRYKAVCISRAFNIDRTWQTKERYEVAPRRQDSEYWLTVKGWHHETGKRTRTSEYVVWVSGLNEKDMDGNPIEPRVTYITDTTRKKWVEVYRWWEETEPGAASASRFVPVPEHLKEIAQEAIRAVREVAPALWVDVA